MPNDGALHAEARKAISIPQRLPFSANARTIKDILSKETIERTVKEAVRHLLTKMGKLYLLVRKASGQNVEHLFHDSLTARFATIYQNRVWLYNRPAGSLSGLGSELERTKVIREGLPEVLKSIGTQIVLDIGCGDLTWITAVDLPCRYVGVDIVPEVVEANAKLYCSPQHTFQVLDATCDQLPKGDTALCREILFHLSFRDIWRLLDNVRNSGCSFLIATTDNNLRLNADIVSGDFRLLNLHRAPFRFPEPILSLSDSSVVPDRFLSVWEIHSLPQKRITA